MPTDSSASLRQMVYLLIGAVGIAVMVAKITGAENVIEPSRYAPPKDTSFGYDREGKPVRAWPATRPEPTPMFSSNDRSRWATIRALVDNGTYEIGKRSNFKDTSGPFDDTGILFENDYRSLDVVMNPDTGIYYSSKPPLLATVLAGEYWVLKKTVGWNIVRDRWPVMVVILLTVNVIPFALYLWVLAGLIERLGTTDFGKLFAFTLAALGTFLTTFSMTLNNHSPAAYAVLFAVAPLLKGNGISGWSLLQVGFFAGLAATLELPAAALAVGLAVPLIFVKPKTALLLVPALLIAPLIQVAMNYAALGKLLPAYSDFGGPWYNFPGSHWEKLKLVQRGAFVPGIDFNRESIPVYAFHLTLGHHGWFSLTPAFVLAFFGLLIQVKRSPGDIQKVMKRTAEPVFTPALIGTLTLLMWVVVLGFYLTQTSSYNYGGNTSGPRWLFWLIPLWILGGLPAFDACAKGKVRQWIAAVLLGFGVLSVFYPAWNPWRNPWILQLCERMDWVNYDRKQN